MAEVERIVVWVLFAKHQVLGWDADASVLDRHHSVGTIIMHGHMDGAEQSVSSLIAEQVSP